MSFIKLEELANQELEVGIQKSLINANDLIEEGDILFNNLRYSRAYALYQLAAEEIGKSRLLFALLMERKLEYEIDYKQTNKDFTHHQTKARSALTFEVIALLFMYSSQKSKSMEERKSAFLNSLQGVHSENDLETLNNNKNNSLYVGVANGKFV